jgi:type II secretory pathway component PulC
MIYSSVPERRTVALVVNGGSMVTLHEGESAGEIEVERIKPDGVQLRHRGRSFTVRARD